MFACLVFPGLEEVFTKPFLQNKEFIKLDFHTFDLQTKTISFLSSN
jgi:hypothetical protein